MTKFTVYVALATIMVALAQTVLNFFDYSFMEWAGLAILRGTSVVVLMGLLNRWYPTQVYECHYMPKRLKSAILSL
ncbi:hypothetical protein [Yersinia ruckeri]|uniref:hypothetical protein n=1 Tax=Yersinia ruckeri TaxID=29486 RepID=UPI00223828CE|nr:hypothetical protein [Yersinia ruckeri]MCW6598887.1 hypothetical protein [Yersinia ruckeri]